MKLAPMSIKYRRVGVRLRRGLRVDKLPRPLMNLKPVVPQVDTERPQPFCNLAVGPATEYPARIGSKRYDITKWFELYSPSH